MSNDMMREAALVEAVTKAILFQDSGSTEDWEANTDLGEAAIAAYRAAQPAVYTVGDMTMERVFKPAGLTNISDLQAVFDQVEKALAAQPVAVPDMSACFMTAESGGGEYKVVLRFQTLAKMQDAHSAMIHWLAAAPKPEQKEAPELTDEELLHMAADASPESCDLDHLVVTLLGQESVIEYARAVIAADRAKRVIN